MAGTVAGGHKAAATNKQRYGSNFYKLLGHKGGLISRGGGFAVNRELAQEAGRRGGKASKRGKATEPPSEYITWAEEQEGQRQLS